MKDKINKLLNIIKEKKEITILLGILIVILIIAAIISQNKQEISSDNELKYSDKSLTITVYSTPERKYYTFTEVEPSKEKIILNKYNVRCYKEDCSGLVAYGDYAVINDNEKTYVYNYLNEKKYYFSDMVYMADPIIPYEGDKALALLGFKLKNLNEKFGFFSVETNKLTIPFEYDTLAEMYMTSQENKDAVTFLAEKNGLTGLVSYRNNSEIIAINNKDMLFFNKNCATINDNGYALYKMDGTKMLNGKTYDKIYTSSGTGYNLVLEGNTVKVLDDDGNLIKTIGDKKDNHYDVSVNGIYDEKNGQKYVSAVFEVGKDTTDCVEYSYNINTKETSIKNYTCIR